MHILPGAMQMSGKQLTLRLCWGSTGWGAACWSGGASLLFLGSTTDGRRSSALALGGRLYSRHGGRAGSGVLQGWCVVRLATRCTGNAQPRTGCFLVLVMLLQCGPSQPVANRNSWGTLLLACCSCCHYCSGIAGFSVLTQAGCILLFGSPHDGL